MKAAKERNELQIIQSDLLNAIKVGYEHKNILKVQKWNRTRNRSSRISPSFHLHFTFSRILRHPNVILSEIWNRKYVTIF